MKRLIGIVLLTLFLFMMGGQRLLFHYFIYRADDILNEQISQEKFDRCELVELKIPVQLPDIYNYDSYAAVSGQVQLSQHCYNYVRLRITKDTLYLMCIPNALKTNLVNANAINARQIDDLPLSRKSPHHTASQRSGSAIYYIALLKYQFLAPFSAAAKGSLGFRYRIESPLLLVKGEPPEIAV